MEAETGRGRVWAAFSDNTVAAWEAAIPPRILGQWSLNWPHGDGDSESDANPSFFGNPFRVAGLCECQAAGFAAEFAIAGPADNVSTDLKMPVPQLIVSGRSREGRPTLLVATMPKELEGRFLEDSGEPKRELSSL